MLPNLAQLDVTATLGVNVKSLYSFQFNGCCQGRLYLFVYSCKVDNGY